MQLAAAALPGVAHWPRRVHTAAPAELNLFTAQLVQDGAPASLNLPASQDRHAVAEDVPPALGLNLPAAQVVHEDAPPVEKFPAAQGWHDAALAAPCRTLKVPAGHALQVVLPAALQ